MKYLVFSFLLILVYSCKYSPVEVVESPDVRILFLHHSTGNNVWHGEKKLFDFLSPRHNQPAVPWLISEYNKKNSTKYAIEERSFPKSKPYGWKNYPFDYYTIWVKNSGDKSYMEEPTLEMLTKDYQVIIFKHCFPASAIQPDDSISSADLEKKTLSNYKLQYQALKEKMHSFPETKFILWTAPALVKRKTNSNQAMLANEFADWVKNQWDSENDNIYIWDFRELETEGGLFLLKKNARSKTDSHPSDKFNEKAAGSFVNRLISVIENEGKNTDLTGTELN